eukprot:9561076-Alexandrium_andersonii.AAC.1
MVVDAPTQPYVAPVGVAPPEETSGEAVRRRNGWTSRAGPYETAGCSGLPAVQHPLEGGLRGARLAMDRLCAHGFPPGYQWSSIVGPLVWAAVYPLPAQAVADALLPASVTPAMLDGFYARVRERWGATTPEGLAAALARSAAWPVGCPRVLPPF